MCVWFLAALSLALGVGLLGMLLPLPFPQNPTHRAPLPSLALALTLRSNPAIHLTDLPPLLPLLATNIALNTLQTPCVASHLPWGTSTLPPSLSQLPDVVLAADCVYFEPAFPLLLETLGRLIGEETVCYFCFKKRRRADMTFMKAARKGFEVREVRDDPERGVWEREGVFMYVVYSWMSGRIGF